MLLRRKPTSDERDFSDDHPTHVLEKCYDYPLPVFKWDYENKHRLPSTVIRYHTQLGPAEGKRFSDIAIDLNWDDVCNCIKAFAKEGNHQAMDALASIKPRRSLTPRRAS
jgi:hypothetical protein